MSAASRRAATHKLHGSFEPHMKNIFLSVLSPKLPVEMSVWWSGVAFTQISLVHLLHWSCPPSILCSTLSFFKIYSPPSWNPLPHLSFLCMTMHRSTLLTLSKDGSTNNHFRSCFGLHTPLTSTQLSMSGSDWKRSSKHNIQTLRTHLEAPKRLRRGWQMYSPWYGHRLRLSFWIH